MNSIPLIKHTFDTADESTNYHAYLEINKCGEEYEIVYRFENSDQLKTFKVSNAEMSQLLNHC